MHLFSLYHIYKIILNKNKFLPLLDELYFRKYIIFSYDDTNSYKEYSTLQ